MKKFVFALLLFLSCDLSQEVFTVDCEYAFTHTEKFKNREQIFDWMFDNYDYVPDIGIDWALPDETYKNGGDCEDWILLLMFFLQGIGIESRMAIVYNNQTDSKHAILKVGNDYLEYTGMNNNYMFDRGIYTLIVEYDYCESIKRAKFYN